MTINNQLNFHGDDVSPAPASEALFHIVPVPLEQSVSYGGGTSAGPAAILEASAQLELFTGRNTPAVHGLHTLPAVDCSGPIEGVLKRIEHAVQKILQSKKVPVVLGGEHTLSLGIISALRNHYQEFGILHFDAHADLRDSYQGSPYSHACVMRRIHELGISVYQIGTRSYSLEEHQYRLQNNIPFIDSEDIYRGASIDEHLSGFPEQVFISFDVDVLDSSLMPATGTPVPGGLGWYQVMWIVEEVMKRRVCLGFDVVEFAPIKKLHAPSFAAAQLVYNMMGYFIESEKNKKFHKLQSGGSPLERN